jgi:hypothetical protein
MHRNATSLDGLNLRRVISNTAATLVAVLPLVSGAEIHQCNTASGWTAQDKPCAVAKQPSSRPTPTPAPQTPRPPMGDPAYEKAREIERRREIDAYAKRAGQALSEDQAKLKARCGERGQADPYIGAPASWVKTCSTWGKPNHIVRTQTGTDSTEMWSYDRGHLYFGPGLVLRTIQSRN